MMYKTNYKCQIYTDTGMNIFSC